MAATLAPVEILVNHLQGVSSVYSGRPGCACGCKGNHSTNPRVIKQIVRKVQQAVIDGYQLQIWPGEYFAVETETRQYIVYTRKES